MFSASAHAAAQSNRRSIHGDDESDNAARAELRQRLNRPGETDIRPRPTGPFDTTAWSVVEAVFPAPVSYVKMTFGSDQSLFERQLFAQRPGEQSIRVSDVTFCVPYGSREGD